MAKLSIGIDDTMRDVEQSVMAASEMAQLAVNRIEALELASKGDGMRGTPGSDGTPFLDKKLDVLATSISEAMHLKIFELGDKLLSKISAVEKEARMQKQRP